MSYSGASSHPLSNLFISNGLPWKKSIESSISNDGFDSVEIIKILTEKDWDELFVGENKPKRRLALIILYDPKEMRLKSPNCYTEVPLNDPNSKHSPPCY